MKKKTAAALAMLLVLCFVSACARENKTLRDGTYTARSSVYENEDGTDDGNGYGEITITIEGGVITACEFFAYEPDGTLKDETYGMANGRIANQDFFNKAQKATAACAEYARMLVESGSIQGVDAISGATINYDAFMEAAEEALAEAAQ